MSITILTTPTYDASGQAVDPSVIKVGDTFWMCVQPFPGGDFTYENPSILVSADGITWAVPEGLTNPIDAHPGGDAYNSDGEIVYDGETFYCFYREDTQAASEYIRLRTSADGVTWSAESTIITSVRSVTRPANPAVLFLGGRWFMWTCDIATEAGELQYRTAPAATGPWSAPTVLDVSAPDSRQLFGIDVIWSHGVFYALITTRGNEPDPWAPRGFAAASPDGLNWIVNPTPVIAPSGGIDDTYDGTLIRAGDTFHVWHGTVTDNVWRIGYQTLDASAWPGSRVVDSLAGAHSAWPSMRP